MFVHIMAPGMSTLGKKRLSFIITNVRSIVIYKKGARKENARNNLPDPNPDKPEPKRTWLVREITNYKSQITNKPQSQNYKLQIKRSPSGKFYTPSARNTKWCLLSNPIGLFVISDIVIWNLFVICIL
jgi:hypothetical protein